MIFGDLVVHIASDHVPLSRIFEGIQEVHYLWGAPIEAAIILILLSTLVGIYCLPAVGVILLVIPAQVGMKGCLW